MPTTSKIPTAAAPVPYRGLRLALAGALAGMFTNTLLHPLDTVKTLRQTDPAAYRGVAPALLTIIQSRGPLALYAGIAPALLGSALSSALYFGVYELAKARISVLAPSAFRNRRSRVPLTAISAACGNIASSVLFVPKEVVKQRMQAGLHSGRFFSAAAAVVRTSGVQGLYRGYKATLLRNIPSTMIRFALYEEFKLLVSMAKRGRPLEPHEYVGAGALAGVLSSTCTTPMDVIKTRLATGVIDPRAGIVTALRDIIRKDGVAGLFVGLRPRLIWSALFASIGFSTYELCKAWMMDMRTGKRTRVNVGEGRESKLVGEKADGVEMVDRKLWKAVRVLATRGKRGSRYAAVCPRSSSIDGIRERSIRML